METDAALQVQQQLFIHAEKKRLDREERVNQEVQLTKIREERELRRELRRMHVFRNDIGDLMVGFTAPNGGLSMCTRLFDVQICYTKRFFSSVTGKSALNITWEEADGFILILRDDASDSRRLRTLLKSHGLIMNVSGRKEKEASDQLLACLKREAEKVEIAAYHGWNMYGDHHWHFATNEEFTWKEIE